MNDRNASAPDRAEADLHRQARRRVALKLGWMIHALIFVMVNAGLYLISEVSGGHGWYRFPLWGWGLGLAIHGIVIVLALATGGMRQRMMDKELQRLRG
jgi:hypothetical protein